MSHENAEGLLSLACPLLVILELGVGNNEAGLCVVPFPAIDLSWHGFTISHLHWVAVNVSKPVRREPLIKVAKLHEFFHENLSLTPVSLHIKELVLVLYALIYATFNEEREEIRVPLIRNESDNELKNLWEVIGSFKRTTTLVEEVYAIRSSLLQAEERGFIKPEERQALIMGYKEKYGKGMSKFPMVYDAFDLIARKIGETTATCLIYNVLHTGNPTWAFFEIILGMCGIKSRDSTYDVVWELLDEETAFIANLSFEGADRFFSYYTEWADPDDSLYRRKALLDRVKKIKQDWSVRAQNTHPKDDFHKFLYGTPTIFLYSEYTHLWHRFSKIEGSEEVENTNLTIVLEAILQQLTTGKGLLCPSGSGCDAPLAAVTVALKRSLRKSGLVQRTITQTTGSEWVVLLQTVGTLNGYK